MKKWFGKWFGLTVCAVALLLAGTRAAHALWLVSHVTPGATADQGRTVRVETKNVRGQKEFRVVIARRAGDKLPIQAFSRASLYVNPDGKPVADLPSERGQSVPMKEARGKDTITYTFRVSPEELPRLRFEFHDSWASSREMVGGGTVYWFNLQEWAAPAKPAA